MGEYQLSAKIPVFNTRELSMDERCDKCGHSAYFVASNGGEDELRFCAHDGYKNMDALKEAGWELTVIDFKPQPDVEPEPPEVVEEIVIDDDGAMA